MKKITDGIIIATIPTGALPIYEAQGWKEVKDEGTVNPVPTPTFKPNSDATNVLEDVKEKKVAKEEVVEENKFADLIEKPISQWTKSEIKNFADENDIDLNGVKSFTDAKNKVKDFIDKM